MPLDRRLPKIDCRGAWLTGAAAFSLLAGAWHLTDAWPARAAGSISLAALGATYGQYFDSLASANTSSMLPEGWDFAETGTNANTTYTAGNGSSNAGDTYSLGATASTERALGGLRSGNLVPVFGASFTNNTGALITSLAISYTGEQWRLGTSGRMVPDRLDFQYSTDAVSLSTGTWTTVAALSFTAPVTNGSVGALDGNLSGNRVFVSGTLNGLNVGPGATIWIRWQDFDASGADDTLGVDEFSLTPSGSAPSVLTLSPSSLPAATVTVAYQQQLTASGGSGSGYTFALTSGALPPGLTLTSGGLLSGTATSNVGTPYTVRITVADSQGATASQDYSLTVQPAPQAVTPISQVQGAGATSPLVGSSVTVQGVVTARRTNGFFVQTACPSVPCDVTAANYGDGNPGTSEGLLVFTGSAPPTSAAIGNLVTVSGTVTEFVPSADPFSPSETELTNPSVIASVAGSSLPPAVALTAANFTPNGGLLQAEPLEGMRVSVASLVVVGPTQGAKSEADATSTSTGIFFGVFPSAARPFREPGIETPVPVPPCAAGSGCNIPVFDGNPERVRINTLGQAGASSPLDVSSGAVVSNIVGVLDYAFRTYTILTDPGTVPSVSGNASATAVPVRLSNEATIASFNLERFYDETDDSGVSDVALTAAAVANRLNKASLAIRNALGTPDILAVVEMENLAILQRLATKINSDASNSAVNYQAYLVEGNDVGGIDVGFLVNAARVAVTDATQFNKNETYVNPANGSSDLLNDRPPLVLRANIKPAGADFGLPVTVIANHLRSLTDIDNAADGPRIRAKRQAQAESLARLIQQRLSAGENVVSVGDYNAFEVNDGYADVIGTIQGTPAPPTAVNLASPDLVSPDLTDLVATLPDDRSLPTPGTLRTDQRYSYSFGGNAQTIDHILVSPGMLSRLSRFAIARVDADFPDVYRSNPNRPERISDHDAPVSYYALPAAVTTQVYISGLTFNRATQRYYGTIVVTNTTGQTLRGPLQIVLAGLTPGITLVNATGTVASGPYVTGVGDLGPGQSVTVAVTFNNPSRAAIDYNPLVYSGLQ